MPDGPLIIRSDGSQSSGRIVDPADWTLGLEPSDLTFIRVDHQARLQFEDVEVIISNEFRLQRGDTYFDLDPGDRSGLGPLLAIYPAALGSASVDGDGTLRLLFDTGDSISVPPHQLYEPWQISGPSTALVVCSPGIPGSLAVWT